MQSEISAWRAKLIYRVQFSEKAVLDRHPKEYVNFLPEFNEKGKFKLDISKV